MGDWQLWKLHTVWDYLFFFLILAAGYAVYRVAVGGLNRNRNLHGQVPRVEKKMKKVLGPETLCFREGSLKTEEGELPFDILCVSSDRVYTVKVFPFGLKVRGGANVPQWQFSDNRETRKEQNPVPGLRNLKNALNKVFTQEGLKNIPVEPLIVFSDNWGSTKFYLEGINYAVGFTRLSDYLKKQPKKIAGRIDSKAVCAALEKCVKIGGPV
ncbi:MAG: hypothetical protein IJT43_01180 [Stomatobaculum sp.]|nr:hypothetical protein [Stomatobaculum sp.]